MKSADIDQLALSLLPVTVASSVAAGRFAVPDTLRHAGAAGAPPGGKPPSGAFAPPLPPASPPPSMVRVGVAVSVSWSVGSPVTIVEAGGIRSPCTRTRLKA